MINRTHLVSLSVLTVFTAIFFFPIVFGGKLLFFGDNLSLKLPNTIYAISRLKQKQLPLWNPHSLSGTPFFADISNTVIYPFTLIYFFLEPLTALNLQIITSIALAGFFSYFLARTYRLSSSASIFSAIIFAFSSTLIHYTSFVNLLNSSIWLPLTILALHRALDNQGKHWAALSAISLSLQILGGHPQPTYYTAVLMLLYSLILFPKQTVLKKLSRLLLIIVLALGISSFVLIPTFQLANHSTRTLLNFSSATLDSLHPMLLLRVFLPNFFDQPQIGMTWGPAWRHIADNTGYSGIISIFLIAVFTKKFLKKNNHRRLFIFFSTVALLSLLLALGKYTPIYHLAYTFLPFFYNFRGPSEALLLFNFSISILAGLAIHRAKSFKFSHKTSIAIKLLSLAVIIVGLVILLITQFQFESIYKPISIFHTLERDKVIISTIATNVIIASFFIFLTAILLNQNLIAGLILLAFLDLFIFNSRYIFTQNKEAIQLSSSTAQNLSQLMTGQDRFLSYQDISPFTGLGNYWENMTLKPPFADSFYTQSELQTSSILNSRLNHLALNWHLPHSLSTPNGYSTFVLKDYQNFVSGTNSSDLNSISLANSQETLLDQLAVTYLTTSTQIIKRTTSLPRARLVNQSNQYIKPAIITADLPEKIAIHTNHNTPSTLVLADTNYPGWQATLNSRPTSIKKYKGVFRQIDLPPGENTVEFLFNPLILKLSALVSASSLVATIILLISKAHHAKAKN